MAEAPTDNNAAGEQELELLLVEEDVLGTATWKQQSTDEALPLLDLKELWENVSSASNADSALKCAYILCDELKQYLWSNSVPKSEKRLYRNSSDPAMFFATPEERIRRSKEYMSTEKDDEEDDDDAPPLNFAEPYLFKLRSENKAPKKNVKQQTPEQLLSLCQQILGQLTDIEKDHPDLFQPVIDVFGLEMTPFFFGRLMEASEQRHDKISEVCRSILYLIADKANSKEMTITMKRTWSKIAPLEIEGSSFYMLCDTLELWSRILRRLKKQRAMFVYDVFTLQEKAIHSVETFMSSACIEEDEPGDPGGLRERIPSIMIKILERLLQAQESGWENNPTLQSVVSKDGRMLQSRIVSIRRACDTIQYLDLSEAEIEKKNSAKEFDKASKRKSPDDSVIDDWLLERKFLLVWAFTAARYVFRTFPSPSVSKTRHALCTPKHADKAFMGRIVTRLDALQGIFARIGWAYPVRALQKADGFMKLDNTLKSATIMSGNELEPTLRFCKNTKQVTFSTTSIASYLFLALRVKGGTGRFAIFDMSLDGTGLDCLEPTYSLYVALPYMMRLITGSTEAVSMIGVNLARMLIDRLSRPLQSSEVLHLVCGDSGDGVDVSVYGFIVNLGKVMEGRQEPGRTRFTYHTLKKYIESVECPSMRFGIVSKLLISAKRTHVAAQYVSLLKDVLDYVNREVENAADKEGLLTIADTLRTRFVEIVFLKYFSPRKDYLSLIDPIVAASSAAYFIAITDKAWVDKGKSDPQWLRPGLVLRRKFAMEYIEVGRECVRAVAAVSEHDIKSVPKAKLRKQEKSLQKNIYDAAKLSLNHSVSAVAMLTSALDIYKELSVQ